MPESLDPFRGDDELIWSLESNWRGYEEGHSPVAINSLGLRGGEVDTTGERLRILFLGDSIVYGHGLPQGSTLPELVQSAWDARHASRRNVEVINEAVPGYSTFQSVKYFQGRGKRLEPKLVLLVCGPAGS